MREDIVKIGVTLLQKANDSSRVNLNRILNLKTRTTYEPGVVVLTGKTRILFPRSTRQLLSSGLAQFTVTVMPMTLPILMTMLQAMIHSTK
jgi:hypothetical protein